MQEENLYNTWIATTSSGQRSLRCRSPHFAHILSAVQLTDVRGCWLDADWFSFPVSAGQTITLTVDPGDYTGTRRLRIYEPGGTQSGSTGQEEFTSVSVTATASGTARVYAMFWAGIGPYELTISVN